MANKVESGPSRRALLKGVGAAGAALGATSAVAAPAVLKDAQAGRRFRALVTAWRGPGAEFVPPTVEEVTLRPLDDRSVLLRVEASAPCYTMVGDVVPTLPRAPGPVYPAATGFNNPPPAGLTARRFLIPNHAHIGVVEAVGPLVKRVQKGDRVIVGVTSQCGQCYQCLNGNAEMCQFTTGAVDVTTKPIANLKDGSPVVPSLGIGGLSELSVVVEEYCFPIFTDLTSVELSLLGDQLAAGLATGMAKMEIRPGSDVVIFGAGLVGLGAVQSARLRDAGRIIVVEPIKARRDMAAKLGATMTLDPAVEGEGLVPKIRDLCQLKTDRRFAGSENRTSAGADYAICTVGTEYYPPKVERSPDPTGVLPMQQTFACARNGGNVMFMGLAQGGVVFPALALAINGGRTIWPGQQGGLQPFRDLPRFVRLVESGRVEVKALIEGTYPLDQCIDAVREIRDRTKIATVVLPNGGAR